MEVYMHCNDTIQLGKVLNSFSV